MPYSCVWRLNLDPNSSPCELGFWRTTKSAYSVIFLTQTVRVSMQKIEVTVHVTAIRDDRTATVTTTWLSSQHDYARFWWQMLRINLYWNHQNGKDLNAKIEVIHVFNKKHTHISDLTVCRNSMDRHALSEITLLRAFKCHIRAFGDRTWILNQSPCENSDSGKSPNL